MEGLARPAHQRQHLLAVDLDEGRARRLVLEEAAGDRERAGRDAVGADIRDLAPIADDTYDCLIVTQVLQYVDDLDAAIASMKRVLKPGGSMLVTVPTMGKLDGQDDDVVGHYWRLSRDSARWLFSKHFAAEDLEIEAWGNVLLGLGFWIGLAEEELPRRAFERFDPSYACGVMVRATKPA